MTGLLLPLPLLVVSLELELELAWLGPCAGASALGGFAFTGLRLGFAAVVVVVGWSCGPPGCLLGVKLIRLLTVSIIISMKYKNSNKIAKKGR